MNGFILASSICYLLAVIFALIFGFLYLLNPKFFHYHEWVLGQKWEKLDIKLQTLIRAFMKGIGGAIIALGVAITAMTIYPFRLGEMWSYYTIPIVSLIGWGFWLYLMIFIRKKAGTRTPIFVPTVGIVLVIIGFTLSFF